MMSTISAITWLLHPLGREAEYCDENVLCVCVCPSARENISGSTCPPGQDLREVQGVRAVA